MKNILVTSFVLSMTIAGFLAILGFIGSEQFAYADQGIICENVDLPECEDANDGTVTEIVSLVLNVLSIIIGVGSVLVLIIAGFMQVVSAGNPDLLKRSKDAIVYAIVGVVVAIFAQVIVQFVLSSI